MGRRVLRGCGTHGTDGGLDVGGEWRRRRSGPIPLAVQWQYGAQLMLIHALPWYR